MADIQNLTEEEKALILAKREYHKKWRAEHKDKVKAANERFYKKQAQKNKKETA